MNGVAVCDGGPVGRCDGVTVCDGFCGVALCGGVVGWPRDGIAGLGYLFEGVLGRAASYAPCYSHRFTTNGTRGSGINYVEYELGDFYNSKRENKQACLPLWLASNCLCA